MARLYTGRQAVETDWRRIAELLNSARLSSRQVKATLYKLQNEDAAGTERGGEFGPGFSYDLLLDGAAVIGFAGRVHGRLALVVVDGSGTAAQRRRRERELMFDVFQRASVDGLSFLSYDNALRHSASLDWLIRSDSGVISRRANVGFEPADNGKNPDVDPPPYDFEGVRVPRSERIVFDIGLALVWLGRVATAR